MLKKLVIISHTEHYVTEDGSVVGWGATVNELNHLAKKCEKLVHVACLYQLNPPKSALPYTQNNIQFVPIPPYGGKSIFQKLSILFKVPIILYRIVKAIQGATEVQLRLPTSIGVFLLPMFTFFIPRKFTLWIKYAGNWGQINPPLSYKFQRWWLTKNFAKCKVTINGIWNNQPQHCISFENPCLTERNLLEAENVLKHKKFEAPFQFIFVGRLNKEKGVDVILQSLKEIPFNKIDRVLFVGDGNNIAYYKKETLFLGEKVQFTGFLTQYEIHNLLQNSHFILLPSMSEGFPKVIAEAACYGVIPIVSNVGSIPHFINNSNGFLWEINSKIPFSKIINAAIEDKNLAEKSKQIALLAKSFTFENYFYKLQKYVLNNK